MLKELSFFAVFSGTTLAHADELIVWNVGQGSWATIRTESQCEHFDLGGEFAPAVAIAQACADRQNEVFYSHWDWDHIALTRLALKILPNLCIQAKPGGETKSRTKLDFIANVPECASRSPVLEIFDEPLKAEANAESRVFVRDRIVFPGDSPSRQELKWSLSAKQARILIAGHHGSKTSTSSALLQRLIHLKLIVVSARKAKYGHPHPSMLARAHLRRRPVLTTEDWGHIHLLINGETPREEKTGDRTPGLQASRFRVRDDGRSQAIR